MKLPIENCRRLFKFRCPKEWEALTPTIDDGVRYCNSCHKNVYLCETPADLRRRANQCVVLEVKGGNGMLMGEIIRPHDLEDTEDSSVGVDFDSREEPPGKRKMP